MDSRQTQQVVPFGENEHDAAGGSCCGFLKSPSITQHQTSYQQQQDQQYRLFQLLQRKTNRENDIDGTKLIAQALSKLSIQQREEALEEVHGVVDETTKEEDPRMVAQCLTKLDEELTELSTYTCAYRQALRMSSTYVQSHSFRLMFLHADEWNVKLAASRMIRFLEEKLELFGPEKLTRDIVLDDLDEEGDLKCLESGFIQRIPLQDRSGRDILAMYPRLGISWSLRNMKKSVYYVTMSVALGNPRAQKLGVIEIEFGMSVVSVRNNDYLSLASSMYAFRSLIPVRSGGAHIGTNDPTMNLVLVWLCKLLPSQIITRLQVHCGTYLEVHYKLLTYGIPVEALPMTSAGEWRIDYHHTWIQKQREKESATDNEWEDNSLSTNNCSPGSSPLPTLPFDTLGMTVQPRSSDVIMGRGRVVDNHPGNVQFRHFLARHAEEYEDLPIGYKRDFAKKLLQQLRLEQKVRFLQAPTTNVKGICSDYQDVTENTNMLLEKISRTFRRFRERNTDKGDGKQRRRNGK